MKRLTSILAISVIAVMSAGAARADIASTTYVDNKVSPVSDKANTNATNITALQSGKQDKSAMVDSDSEVLNESNETNYPTVAAAWAIANNAVGNSIGTKLDKQFPNIDANKSKAVITDANGNITTGTISSAMITDGTIVNADIAADAAIAQSKIAGLTDSIADAKSAGTAATSALNSYKTSNDAALANVKTTAEKAVVANTAITAGTGTKITYDTKGLVTKSESLAVSDIPSGLINAGTNVTVSRDTTTGVVTISSADTKYTLPTATDTVLGGVKVDTALSSTSTNPVQNKAVNTALAGKQATLTDAQLAAANSGITSAKVSTYDTAVTTANAALPASTYNTQVGTVSAVNMGGTTATTVVGAIKEIKTAVTNADAAAVKTAQGADNKNKAVITNDSGNVTTGTIATGMIADSAVTTAKIADSNVTEGKIAASAVTTAKIKDANVTTAKIADSAVTSAKIADGTIVNADIASNAAIDQSKINGLTADLAAKFVAPAATATSTDGTYTLTMKVVNSVPTYTWEQIGR